MQNALPIACFLSVIRPPGVQFENALLQISPVNKDKCPFVRDKADIGFLLFTRHNPNEPQPLAIDDDESLFASNIDFHDNTVIYFHAFMETPMDGSALNVKEAFVHRGDTNIIMVDAQRLEAGPWYFTAASNTWYIGRIAAQFIDYLVSRGLKLSKTHLVGHSLGAQSAGVAGHSIKSGQVSRITGLDPALPLFDKVPLDQRLDPSDAEFVDVIHTDAGIFGYNRNIGHVDFYPNGGISPQPGCELEVVVPQQELLNKCDGNLDSSTNQKILHKIAQLKKIMKTENSRTKKSIPTNTLLRKRRSIPFLNMENGWLSKLFAPFKNRMPQPVISIMRDVQSSAKFSNKEFQNSIKDKIDFGSSGFQFRKISLDFGQNPSFWMKFFGLGGDSLKISGET